MRCDETSPEFRTVPNWSEQFLSIIPKPPSKGTAIQQADPSQVQRLCGQGTSQSSLVLRSLSEKMRVLLPHQRDWDMVLTSSILGKFMSSLSDILNHVHSCTVYSHRLFGEKGGHKNGCLGIVRPNIWPESICVFQNGEACFVAGCILNLLSEVFKLIIFLAFLIIVPWFLGTLRFHLSPCLSPVIEDPQFFRPKIEMIWSQPWYPSARQKMDTTEML